MASEQLENLFSGILDTIDTAALILDWADRPVAANRRMERLTGASLAQLQYLHKVNCFALRYQAKFKAQGLYELTVYRKNFRLEGRLAAETEDYRFFLFSADRTSAGEPEERPSFDALHGVSSSFHTTVEACRAASQPCSFVLLTGESGTGKETLARCIHREGIYPADHFILVRNNQEFSQLFSEGKPVLAQHTLYIDEFANFNHYNQDLLMDLLRGCLNGGYMLICATSANLDFLLSRGELHRNLYHALLSHRIPVPSLRQRREDIPLLADDLMLHLCGKLNRNLTLSEPEKQQISAQEWPGNLNELMNFLTRCIRQSPLLEGQLPESTFQEVLRDYQAEDRSVSNFSLARAEHDLIEKALNAYGDTPGGKKRCAEALGISLATLYRKMAQYGIRSYQYYQD